MNRFDSSITTISLALEAHGHAKRFQQHHGNPSKAKVVYLNTLAVCAVKTYLERSGFDPDLGSGGSWQPSQQTLMDIADLWLPGYGRVECRPVLPGQTVMQVPPEVWDDRLCYVAVQLDATLRTANILGFVNTVTTQQILLRELQPLEDFVGYLLRQSKSNAIPPSRNTPATIQVSQWLQNAVDMGWQTIENLVEMAPDSGSPQLAWGFRQESGASSPDFNLSSLAQPSMVRAKQLTLALEEEDVRVALMVGLPTVIQPDMDIRVQVVPIPPPNRLPENLMLMVLDETGSSVMQAQARSSEAMELRFGVNPGEVFSLKLELDGVSITESFVV